MKSLGISVFVCLVFLTAGLALGGCAETEGQKKADAEVHHEVEYQAAQETLEEEGYDGSAAGKARGFAEEEELSGRETVELGAIAKHMGGR
jgi:hypothetical protein